LTYYPLKIIDNFTFQFTTEQELLYVVYFVDYSAMFYEFPHIAEYIYSFNIDVLEGEMDESIKDDKIGITIAEVFKMFFNELENVAVYVCDMIDKRHFARKRKFDIWFNKYNDGTILKEDGIAIIEDVEIINSLLISSHHPKLKEILVAYKSINERAGDK
jgi:hypothetical protein